MQKEMEWNTEVTKIHHTNYVRNSRAIAVAWFVFCACYTILNIVVFIQPFWFGDTNESPGVGYFGTYEWCERVTGSEYRCKGDFLDFNTIKNDYFRASSFLVGGACLLFIFSIICMLLFLFLKPIFVLKLCGTLQLIAAIFMAVACIIYPNGFDDDNVRRICGQEADAYNMDKCQIRWAYILAIVLIFDALILSILAFVLSKRQAREIAEMPETKAAHMSYVHEWTANSFDNNGFAGEFVDVVPSARVKTIYQPRPAPIQNPARTRQISHLQSISQSARPFQPPEDLQDSPRGTDPSSSISLPSPRSNDEGGSPRSNEETSPRSNDDDMSPRSNDDGDDFVIFADIEGGSSRSSSPSEVRSRSNRSGGSRHSDRGAEDEIRL